MTTWEHRIVRLEDGTLQFAEVSYDGRLPVGFNEIFSCGDNLADMREIAARLAKACDHPIIDEKDIGPMPSVEDMIEILYHNRDGSTTKA